MADLLTPKPDYVPEHLVVDHDYVNLAGMAELGVYAAVKRLHDGPDIFWTPRHGGHWVVTRAEDVKFVQENYAIFSHEEFMIPRVLTPFKPIPLAVDPPNHARYRAVLNPAFFTQQHRADARRRQSADDRPDREDQAQRGMRIRERICPHYAGDDVPAHCGPTTRPA